LEEKESLLGSPTTLRLEVNSLYYSARKEVAVMGSAAGFKGEEEGDGEAGVHSVVEFLEPCIGHE
jgi:hypothetical protein